MKGRAVGLLRPDMLQMPCTQQNHTIALRSADVSQGLAEMAIEVLRQKAFLAPVRENSIS